MRPRHAVLWAVLVLSIPLVGIDDPAAQAKEALKKGDYAKAEKAFEALIAKDEADPDALTGLAEVHLVTGKYPSAERSARKAIECDPEFSPAYGVLAEALYTVGKYGEADKVATKGIEINDLDVRSRFFRAMARYDTGQYDVLDASQELDWFLSDFEARAEKWSERDWLYGGQGIWLYGRYAGEGGVARSLVENLVGTEPIKTSADLIAMLGWFHVEWYDYPGAKTDFKEALDKNPQHPWAMLGAELVGGNEGQNPYEAKMVRAPQVLKVNPNLVEAHCQHAAKLLGADQFKEAIEAADKALAVNPNHVAALAYKATATFLSGKHDAVDGLAKKALEINPKGGEFYYVLGEGVGNKRMTMTSYEYLKAGVDLDPKNTKLLISLGQCEMNLGEDVAAKEHLEAAYARNKSNVWTVNYLQLLDAYFGTKDKEATYLLKTSPHYRYRMHKSEVAWLEDYAIDISERCYAEFAKRYKFEPHQPVTLELFPFHNDFSARTIGLPGLPAAGACLGRVVATLSPRAKEEMGPFNWGAVLWHEVAHVFAVQQSDEKTPRWFTEGLSTYEEKRYVEGWEFSGGGGWSSDLRLKTFQNYHLGKLIPLERLNEGFGGGDVIFYYYYASLIHEFTEKTWGFEKIPQMLLKYAEGKKDPEAFKEVYGIEMKEFEKRFHQWIHDEYMKDIKLRAPLKDEDVAALERKVSKNKEDHESMGKLAYHLVAQKEITKGRAMGLKCLEINPKNVDALVAMGRVYMDRANKSVKKARKCFEDAIANGGGEDYVVHWEFGKLLQEDKKVEEAIEQFEAASRMFPRFAPRNDNVYKRLVELYEQAGEEDKAVTTLERWAPIDYGDFPIRMKLAAAYRSRGMDDKAIHILEEAIWIEPMDIKLHAWLAEGYRKRKELDRAAKELSHAIAVTARANEKVDPPGKLDHLIAGFWCDTAEIRLEQGRKDDAKDAVDQALFVDPESERAKELEDKLYE